MIDPVMIGRHVLRSLVHVVTVLYLTLFVSGDGLSITPVEPNDSEVIAAEGVGAPWISFGNGAFVPARLVGDEPLKAALISGRAKPVALARYDMNGDGGEDYVVGYASTPPFVTIRLAHPDHYRNQRRLRGGVGPSIDQPFLRKVQLVRVGTQPDHLAVGNFDDDAYADIVTGARAADKLSIVNGTDLNTYLAPRFIELPGRLTMMRSADVNRRDRKPDLLIGVNADAGSSLLLYEHFDGALATDPIEHPLPNPAVDAIVNQFDDHYAFDIAVATTKEVVVLAGRDRSRVVRNRRSWNLPELVTWRPGSRIASLSSGDFVGNRTRDIVLLDESGRLFVYDLARRTAHQTAYHFPASGPGHRAHRLYGTDVASLPGDDLLILDREAGKLHVLHASQLSDPSQPDGPHATTELTLLPSPAGAVATIDIRTPVIDVSVARLNTDGLDDLVVLAEPPVGASPLTDGIAVSQTLPRETFEVNVDAFTFDSVPGDGKCADSQGNCSLKAAIREANDFPGPDKITFAISTLAEQWGEQIFETVEIDGSGPGRVVITSSASFSFAGAVGNSSIHGVAMAGHAQFTSKEGGHDVFNNYFGTDGTGMTGAPNTAVMTIQTPDIAIFDNVIANNIAFEEPGVVVIGNNIGVNRDQSDAIGPGGLALRGPVGNRLGAHNAYVAGNVMATGGSGIGGTAVSARNVDGIRLEGNSVGVSADGQIIFGSLSYGIEMLLTRAVTLSDGGEIPSVVAGATWDGLRLGQADSTIVQRTSFMHNTRAGINLFDSRDVILGGERGVDGNRIFSNEREGITVHSDYPVTIQGNLVGAVSISEQDIGNFLTGIHLEGPRHVVGDPDSPRSYGNVIGGNGEAGISLRSADSIVVVGNYIGTNEILTPGLGNMTWGIEFEVDASDVRIGGTTPGQTNYIAYNRLDGIYISNVNAGSSRRNSFLANAIFENGELGIDLSDVRENSLGINANDPGDADEGSNALQNYPVLTLNTDGSVHAELNTTANMQYRVEFFGSPDCDASGHGEGHEFLAAHMLTTNDSGIAQLDQTFEVLDSRRAVSATATDPLGNTSEFSNCVEVSPVAGLVIRVMQDSLQHTPLPVANTPFVIGIIKGGGPDFTILDSRVTNEKGIIELRPQDFNLGDPFFLITYPHDEPAKKSGHEDVDNVMYRVSVDNLFVSKDGVLWPDTLDADTTVTYLGHTTLTFNLTVGIEWPASDAYVENLKSAFRSASNYLYDVSNGQARLGTIAIYDQKSKWDQVDLRVYAANTQWPEASANGINNRELGAAAEQMRFPPAHFGGETLNNVDLGFRQQPLDPSMYAHFSTLIHEFGHHAFGLLDEYREAGGREICKVRLPLFDDCVDFYNFGFMDKQMRQSEPMSSEMSAFITTPDYRLTWQFDVWDMTSWDAFRSRYRKTFGTTRAEIHTPKLLRLPTDAFVAGPNDNLSAPDVDVGREVQFVTSTSSSSQPRVEYLVKDESGAPLSGVFVEIERDGGAFTLVQGKSVIGNEKLGTTADRGKIRLLGARDGDFVNFSTDGKDGTYRTLREPVRTTGKIAPIEVTLRTMSGQIKMLAEVLFGAGGALEYTVDFDRPLSSVPTLVVASEGVAVDVPLRPNGSRYSATLPDASVEQARMRLEAPDSLGQVFFVMHALSVFDVTPGAELRMANDNFELFINSSNTTLQKLAVTSVNFPSPTFGIPDSTRRASPLYSVRGFPEVANLDASITIYYDADSLLAANGQAVTIYRWDGTWTAMPTAMTDATIFPEATTTISQPGIYAAFIDLTQTTQVSVEPGGGDSALPRNLQLEVFPNPAQSTSTIAYELPRNERVSVSVYDVLGRKVATLIEEHLTAGWHHVRLDTQMLSSGVYFVTLRSGNATVSRTMVILR